MMRKVVLLSLLCNAAIAQTTPVQAPAPEGDLEPIIVTASGDPILTAIRLDAEDHRRKVVAQTCTWTAEDKNDSTQQTRSYAVDGSSAFKWTLINTQINGRSATDKENKKAQKEQEGWDKDRSDDKDERYSIFADLIAERDRVEKLPPQDGMLRYRINRLPQKLIKNIPNSIAKNLQPIIWIADAENMPYVKRLEVTMKDVRVYLVAKVNSVNMDIHFERRADGYVKERDARFEGNFSLFGRKIFNRDTVTCDLGGPIATRPEVEAKK
jgi:hypothetical protein